MHSWASWFLLVSYAITTLNAIAEGAKQSPRYAVAAGVGYAAIILFVALVVLPTGGFVW